MRTSKDRFAQVVAEWMIREGVRCSDIADLVQVDVYAAIVGRIEAHVIEERTCAAS